jgi:hypothetical protein
MELSESVVIVTIVLSDVGAFVTSTVQSGARVIFVFSETNVESSTGQTTKV